MSCNVAALFKHWLQASTIKAYFCAVKVADLELTGERLCFTCSCRLFCPAHTAQRQTHYHIFHQRASATALQPSDCIFVSSASGFSHHKVITRDNRSLFFLQLIDSYILAGCISIIFDDSGSDCQLLAVLPPNPLKSIDCPSLSPCFHWFSLLIFTPHSSCTQHINPRCLFFLHCTSVFWSSRSCLVSLKVNMSHCRKDDELILNTICQKLKKQKYTLNYSDLNL